MIVNHLWQSTLFAAAAALLALALRRNHAQVRYWLWLAASLKFLLPFSLLVTAGNHFGRNAPPASAPMANFSAVVEQINEPFSAALPAAAIPVVPHSYTVPILLTIWAAGFLALTASWMRRWWRLGAAVRAARPLDLAIPIPVRTSPAFGEPGAFGILRPILLLPEGIAECLSAAEFQAILEHEQCHVRRRDNLTAALHMVVEAVFWFHPLVWWLGARLLEERERAVDEAVLRAGGEPHTYAEGILKICELYLASELPCVAGVTGGNLKKRIEAIVANRAALRLTYGRRAILAAAGVAAISLPLFVGIVHTPAVRAQETRPKFDVASIRPCDPRRDTAGRGGGRKGGGGTPGAGPAPGIGGYFGRTPGNLNITCGSLISMMDMAYVRNGSPLTNDNGSPMLAGERIKGVPAWAMDARYTIEAKTDNPVANGPTEGPNSPAWKLLAGPMLQTLLEDRFQLKFHREEEQVPMYALRVAKGGLKIKPMPEGGCTAMETGPGGVGFLIKPIGPFDKPYCHWMGWPIHGPNRMVVGGDIPLSRLAGMLSDEVLDRHVIDETGITDLFNISLEYAPDERTRCFGPEQMCAVDAASDIPAGADIFTALEKQLGLKLEPIKGPRGFIAIDRVERPSAN